MKRGFIVESKSKLIILRGNSGSGKTSTGKALQKKFGRGTLLISQDVVRRDMLHVKDGADPECSQLILEIAKYGKSNHPIIILEGILVSKWYQHLFKHLQGMFGEEIYAFYFDVPFEETLKRHEGKPNAHEFGEIEMRSWWQEKDVLGFIPEHLLYKDVTLNEVVDLVYNAIEF